MYADDLILISRPESGLQALLNRLGNYCRKWRMEVNIEKPKVMKYSGNGHKCKTFSYITTNLLRVYLNINT